MFIRIYTKFMFLPEDRPGLFKEIGFNKIAEKPQNVVGIPGTFRLFEEV